MEAFALLLKINTMIFAVSSASMIDSAHKAPGVMSRGAIQHLTRWMDSSWEQTAFAITRSLDA